jgi:3-oxoacyl-[acyl-carrier protein] reductase
MRAPGSVSLAETIAVLHRNVDAAIWCSEAFGAHFCQRGGGHIVNLTSTAAVLPISTPTARFYAAAKGAVESYSESLAARLAPSVLVNTVAPGLLADGRTTPPGGARSCYPDDAIPLRRRGRVEEVASLIVWLILDNSYATGSTFVIDGGLTATLPLPGQ